MSGLRVGIEDILLVEFLKGIYVISRLTIFYFCFF